MISCIDYNFTVAASTVAGEGPINSVLSQSEEEGKNVLSFKILSKFGSVPDAPSELTCQAMSSTIMIVGWKSPVTKCRIRSYLVEAEGDVLWDPETTESNTYYTSDTNLRLTDLTPYTQYNVTVQAKTEGGIRGLRSNSCLDTTLQAGKKNRKIRHKKDL